MRPHYVWNCGQFVRGILRQAYCIVWTSHKSTENRSASSFINLKSHQHWQDSHSLAEPIHPSLTQIILWILLWSPVTSGWSTVFFIAKSIIHLLYVARMLVMKNSDLSEVSGATATPFGHFSCSDRHSIIHTHKAAWLKKLGPHPFQTKCLKD